MGDVPMTEVSIHLVRQLAERLLQKAQNLLRGVLYRGLIAKSFTDLAGSSVWFERGFVTYSNAAKTEMLGVPESLIDDYGAVSEAVANAMAIGALEHSAADWSILLLKKTGNGRSWSILSKSAFYCRDRNTRMVFSISGKL